MGLETSLQDKIATHRKNINAFLISEALSIPGVDKEGGSGEKRAPKKTAFTKAQLSELAYCFQPGNWSGKSLSLDVDIYIFHSVKGVENIYEFKMVLPLAERDEIFVDNGYQAIMGRPVDANGLKVYLEHLSSGRLGRISILEALAKSQEAIDKGIRYLFIPDPSVWLGEIADTPQAACAFQIELFEMDADGAVPVGEGEQAA